MVYDTVNSSYVEPSAYGVLPFFSSAGRVATVSFWEEEGAKALAGIAPRRFHSGGRVCRSR